MTDQQQYFQNRARLGWTLLAAGVVILIISLILQFAFSLPFNPRIIGGLGILFAGLGLAQVVRYHTLKGDRKAAARLINAEQDERNQLIRTRAGSRAFWVSLALSFVALMWLSFASNGSLPTPSLDALWLYLAAAVVLSFGVYIASIVYDQKNS